MTLRSGDYVIRTVGAGGKPCAMKVSKTVASGGYAIRARCADGEHVAVGVNRLTSLGDVGIAAACATGGRAFVGSKAASVLPTFHESWMDYYGSNIWYDTCAEALGNPLPLAGYSYGFGSNIWASASWTCVYYWWSRWGGRGVSAGFTLFGGYDDTLYPGHNSGLTGAYIGQSAIILDPSCTEPDGSLVGQFVRVATYYNYQIRQIVAFNGTSRVATVSPAFKQAVSLGTAYSIIRGPVPSVISALTIEQMDVYSGSTPAYMNGINRFDAAGKMVLIQDPCEPIDMLLVGFDTMPTIAYEAMVSAGEVLYSFQLTARSGTFIPPAMGQGYKYYAILPASVAWKSCPSYCSTAGGARMLGLVGVTDLQLVG